MKKFFFIAIVLILFGTWSCNEDVNPYQPCFTVQDTTRAGYFPLKPGTYWKYVDTPLVAGFYFDIQVTKDTLVVSGRTYRKVVINEKDAAGNITGQEFSYFMQFNNDVYEYYDGNEHLILKENAAVNATWEVTYDSARYRDKYKIIAKGITVTVNGITYKNVMVVEQSYYEDIDGNGIFTLIPDEVDYTYYAKGIGEILWYYTDDLGDLYGEQLSCFSIL